MYLEPVYQKRLPMSKPVQYEMEFPIHASAQMLYQYIATPSGLAEWFADDVNMREDYFVFIWDNQGEEAELVTFKTNKCVQFRWLNSEPDTFFEMRIVIDEITEDVSLLVTDFSEEAELEESKMVWTNQVAYLKHILGSA